MRLVRAAWRRLLNAFHGAGPSRRPRRASGRPRPAVESLEDRTVPSTVPPTVAPNDPFLFTPVDPSAPLALHIHPHLTILVNGSPVRVPAGIGIQTAGDLPLHTHDASGTIHVESPAARTFILADFFAVWGRAFSNQQVLRYRADATHRIRMTVNGRPSTAFGSLVLQDGQQIVIRFVKVARQAHRPGL
jgi:hypothetical protein